MRQKTGETGQESWGISPLTSRRLSETKRVSKLPRKILAGSFAGVFMGMALSLLIDPPAHADISTSSTSAHFPHAITGSKSVTTLAPPQSRHTLILDTELSEDYRHRIPAWRKPEKKNLAIGVTATAYNNVPAQTDDTPDIAAWGDRIEPGMPLIAVSRDLLDLGLTRGMKVRISGLEGEFIVLDKMNRRYKKRIDVYMGKNVKAARKFGKRKVTLTWNTDAPMSGPTLLASAN